MKTDFRQSQEYKDHFSNTRNVRFLPDPRYLGDWPERQFVQYPLASMIARGSLKRNPNFRSFSRNSVLVLCNFKLPVPDAFKERDRGKGYTDKNNRKAHVPDILAVTSNGDALLVECKRSSESTTGIAQLVQYLNALRDFAKHATMSTNNPWNKFQFCHDDRYERYGFPNLLSTVETIYGFQSYEEKFGWAERIMKCVLSDSLYYAVAYDGIVKEKDYKNMQNITKLDMPFSFVVDHKHRRYKILNLYESE